MTRTELAALDDEALKGCVDGIVVFARVLPERPSASKRISHSMHLVA